MKRAAVIYEYQSLCDQAERTQAALHTWPRELAQPIIARLRTPWQQREFRAPLAGAGLTPYKEVIEWADAIRRELQTLKLEMVSGDAELVDMAQRCARMCQQYPNAAEWIVLRVGLEVPDGRHMTDEGKLLRMQDSRWWRRRMRAHFGQAVESAMRSRGLVRRNRAVYCSDWALHRRRSQKAKLKAMLQEAVAVNELGEQLEMFKLAEKSLANPVVRRAELMTRIRGFEELADEAGHMALFVTATAPSAFHPQLAKGGTNPNYEGHSVRDAQSWLCKQWARVRAKLHRMSIAFYGFRIAEPHHDATPHWHMILFMARESAERLQAVIRGFWLSEYAHEAGATERRVTFKEIDPSKGSAAGYIAKYVAKNIDGFNVGRDYEASEENATSTAERVEAWASTHRIRQFQQLGGVAVGLWREFRRARSRLSVAQLETCRVCADNGDWAGFVKAAFGVSLWKEQSGECTQYREVKTPSTIGVMAEGVKVRTRIHEWRVQWKAAGDRASEVLSHHVSASTPIRLPSLGPVAITVRSETPRGDGLMLYQHSGHWFAHRAISKAEPPGSKLNQRYQFVQSVPYKWTN